MRTFFVLFLAGWFFMYGNIWKGAFSSGQIIFSSPSFTEKKYCNEAVEEMKASNVTVVVDCKPGGEDNHRPREFGAFMP